MFLGSSQKEETMHLQSTLPVWADHSIALPLLVMLALSINILTAVWMQPYLKRERSDETCGRTTLRITAFSMVAILLGAFAAYWQISIYIVLSVGVIGFGLLAMATKLPKRLLVVTGVISMANFMVGEVAVTENSLSALFLMIAGIVIMCILAITIMPLTYWRNH